MTLINFSSDDNYSFNRHGFGALAQLERSCPLARREFGATSPLVTQLPGSGAKPLL